MGAGEKIAIISEGLNGPRDDGYKRFARSLAEVLQKQNDVLAISVDGRAANDDWAVRVPAAKAFLSEDLHDAIHSYSPGKIIYVPSASLTGASFSRARALRLHARRARIGLVGLRALRRDRAPRLPARLLSPHAVFVFSYHTLLKLRRKSVKAELLPMGVDSSVFRPAQSGEKEELRAGHGIPQEAFVFLHTGPLRPSRNLSALAHLASMPASQVVMVTGSVSEEDERLRGHLESSGVRIICDLDHVEQYFRLSDCYVFPVEDPSACSEIPPGVLEALASGIPVISRHIGGVRDMLPEGEDLIFRRTNGELLTAAGRLQSSAPPRVRSVCGYTWESVADQLMGTLDGRK